jgi:hypothetical protein
VDSGVTTRQQCFLVLRQAIAGYLVLLLLVGCTTVTPPVASHPDKPLETQNNDKFECWMEARYLTGHDPEGSSRGWRIIGTTLAVGASGYLLARHPGPWAPLPLLYAPTLKPEQHDAPVIEKFREAYVTCLTGRGYSIEGAR